MKQYIKLTNCEWISLHEEYDDRVQFFNPQIKNLGEKIVEFTHYCNEYMVGDYKKITIYNLIDFLEHTCGEMDILKELWVDLNQLWDEEEEWSEDRVKIDMLKICQDKYYMELLMNTMTDYWDVEYIYGKYLEFLGYQFDTIGYPNWGYYVATSELNQRYISDLWDGTDFYDIEVLNEQGEVVDMVCECYLPNNESLVECMENHFGINKNDINLINNECSTYFDFKKYAMIPIDYEFTEVK